MMDLSERKKVLLECRPRGGNEERKLQYVLDSLWRVAQTNAHGRQCVDREVFQASIARLRPYIWKLERAGCVRLTVAGERGATILTITLLQKKVRPSVKGQKPMPVPQAERVVHPQAKHDKLPPHCLVFMDMPNFLYFERNEDDKLVHILDLYRMNWDKFRKVIENITEVPLEHQTCYAYFKMPKKDSDRLENETRRLTRFHEIKTFVRKRKEKDVDPMMDPMVVSESLKYMLCKERELKVVMVSGDSDHSFALIEVRNWAKLLKINLTVYVLAWQESLSGSDSRGELLHIADEVHHVETYLKEIDPRGHSILTQHRQAARAA